MSEEMWHVQIEPGEVKHLTLEQLDDMFRLDLISADTLVWQPGMAKALPLSVVAGMDDDEESDVMEIEPELLPEPAYSPRSVAPAPASTGYRASASVSAWPAAPMSASAYPSVAPAPAPASVRPSAAPALASTYPSAAPSYASAYPPVVQAPASVRNPTMAPPALAASAIAPVARAPIAPVMPSPDFLSPESLRPITMSDMPGLRGGGGGNMGKVLIGVAIAAGLLVTLYRNDLLRPMAESAGQKSAYEKLESALGAPGFGTPQAVTQMSTTLNPETTAAALTDTSTTPSTTSTTPTTTTTTTATTDSNDSTASSDNVPASERGMAAPPQAKQSPTTSSVRKASGSAPAPRSKPKAPPGKGMKAYKGSEYDPMNAKL